MFFGQIPAATCFCRIAFTFRSLSSAFCSPQTAWYSKIRYNHADDPVCGGMDVRFISHFSNFALFCSFHISHPFFSVSQLNVFPVCFSMNSMAESISATAYSWTSSRFHRSGIFSGCVGSPIRRSCSMDVMILPSQGMLEVTMQQPIFGKSSSMASPASNDGSGQTSAGNPWSSVCSI